MSYKFILILSIFTLLGCTPRPDPKVEALERELKELREKQKMTDIANEVEKAKTTKISGSVFIVTKGGTNYKLGLVTVKALPVDEWTTHITDMFNSFVSRMETYNSSYQEEVENSNLARITADEKLAIYEKHKAPYYLARTKLEQYGSIFDSLDQFMPEYGVNVVAAKNALVEFRDKYNVLALAGADYETARVKVIQARSAALSTRQAAQQLYDTHIASIIEMAASLNVVKTDADGRFELTLPRGMDYVLVATGSRAVGDDKEYYEWVVPINISEKQEHLNVMLSNDSLSESLEPYSSRIYNMIPEDLPDYPYISIISEPKTYRVRR